jgi:hypothetical protein
MPEDALDLPVDPHRQESFRQNRLVVASRNQAEIQQIADYINSSEKQKYNRQIP